MADRGLFPVTLTDFRAGTDETRGRGFLPIGLFRGGVGSGDMLIVASRSGVELGAEDKGEEEP